MDNKTSSSTSRKVMKYWVCLFGLSSGFILSSYDIVLAQSVSISDSVTITAVVPETTSNTPPPPDTGGGVLTGGGGGGGGGVILNNASTDSVVFKGIAYPSSIVTLLKNGVILVELPANPNGTFEIKVKDLPSGTYSFAIRAEDGQHNRSALDLYTVYVTPGVSTVVDGIFIPPTITTDKVEVKQGDPIIISGNSAPSALLTISIHSGADLLKKIASNTSGFWSYKLDSSELDLGEHETRAKASTGTNLSLFSDTIKFIVGTKNRQRTASSKIVSSNKKCDINNDGRVNLLDFSIMAFWYKRTGFPTKVDLNADNRVDLSDVSILAFCWTG